MRERTFLGVLPAQIGGVLAATCMITDLLTGAETVEPGWKLMAMIKAATEAVYDASQIGATRGDTLPAV